MSRGLNGDQSNEHQNEVDLAAGPVLCGWNFPKRCWQPFTHVAATHDVQVWSWRIPTLIRRKQTEVYVIKTYDKQAFHG